jgi:hypothetical protein
MSLFASQVLLCSSFFFPSAVPARVPEGVIFFPDQPSFGVNVHTMNNGKELRGIGANWVRLDFRWNGFETKVRGKYSFEGADGPVKNYADNRLNILGLLSYADCSPLYDPAKDFEASIKGFAAFCRACAEHFKGKVKIWELCNEPEGFNKGGINDPKRYTQLARAAAKAIREVDPEVRIGACSTAWMDRGFFSGCFEAGLLKDGTIDVVTFHGYHRVNMMAESGLKEDVGWLRSQVRRYAPKDKKIIVVDSERGYLIDDFLKPKHWAMWRNITYSETEQAAYLARHFLEEISLGIEVSIWYKDMWGEQNFSLFSGGPGSPLRKMGQAYRHLAQLFDVNPKQMANRKYSITLEDLPDQISDPNSFMKVKSYVRTYLKDNKPAGEKLIITMWNPVEAFDGKILQSRQRIGEYFYEAWRAVSPEDKVEVPVKVNIVGVAQDRIARAYRVDLLAVEDAKLKSPLKINFSDKGAVTETLNVGPIPLVIVVELKK